MENITTKNYLGFEKAAEMNWYLTCMPTKPVPKVKIRLEDGKEYVYKGKNTIKVGDVAVIGRGCKTSFEMGQVTAVGATGGGKSYASKAQYVFATNPSQDEIKKMSDKICNYQDVQIAFKQLKLDGKLLAGNVEVPVVDADIESVLFACCVLSNQSVATTAAIKKAKECLETPKFLCAELLGTKINKNIQSPHYPNIYLQFSGYYPTWEEEFHVQPICVEMESKRSIYLYENSICYEKGSKDLEKFVSGHKEFSVFYNELIFRSALSILIRGGFVNLLRQALSLRMPIGDFYDKLIDLAKEIGSTYCLALLQAHRAEYTQ